MTKLWHDLKWSIRSMHIRQAQAYIIAVCEEHGMSDGETDILLGSLINKVYR